MNLKVALLSSNIVVEWSNVTARTKWCMDVRQHKDAILDAGIVYVAILDL